MRIVIAVSDFLRLAVSKLAAIAANVLRPQSNLEKQVIYSEIAMQHPTAAPLVVEAVSKYPAVFVPLAAFFYYAISHCYLNAYLGTFGASTRWTSVSIPVYFSYSMFPASVSVILGGGLILLSHLAYRHRRWWFPVLLLWLCLASIPAVKTATVSGSDSGRFATALIGTFLPFLGIASVLYSNFRDASIRLKVKSRIKDLQAVVNRSVEAESELDRLQERENVEQKITPSPFGLVFMTVVVYVFVSIISSRSMGKSDAYLALSRNAMLWASASVQSDYDDVDLGELVTEDILFADSNSIIFVGSNKDVRCVVFSNPSQDIFAILRLKKHSLSTSSN